MNARTLFWPILRPWKNRRVRRFAAAFVILGIVAANAMAYMQARAMTHFTVTNHRTLAPESLSAFQKLEVLFTGVRLPCPVNLITPADVHLRYQTFRFGGANSDDCEAWYIAAPPRSLAHPASDPVRHNALCIGFTGYVASKSSLLPAAKAFNGMRYDAMLVDFRGTGGSRGDQTTIGYDEADDVAAADQFARQKWPGEPIILYGQSMGGAAILRAVAELHLSPRGIILESVYDRLLATVENRFTAMHLPGFPLSQLLMFWGSVQMGHNAFDFNPVNFATNVRCPALLMQGGRDPRVTDAEAKNLFDHLAGLKQFAYFPAAGHCEFLDRDRQRWIAAVATFVQTNTN
jgi:alpha-beta hydrolase superfamily lysophospholipase